MGDALLVEPQRDRGQRSSGMLGCATGWEHSESLGLLGAGHVRNVCDRAAGTPALANRVSQSALSRSRRRSETSRASSRLRTRSGFVAKRGRR